MPRYQKSGLKLEFADYTFGGLYKFTFSEEIEMPQKMIQELTKGVKAVRLLEGKLQEDKNSFDPVYNFVEDNISVKVVAVSTKFIIFRLTLDDYASVNLSNQPEYIHLSIQNPEDYRLKDSEIHLTVNKYLLKAHYLADPGVASESEKGDQVFFYFVALVIWLFCAFVPIVMKLYVAVFFSITAIQFMQVCCLLPFLNFLRLSVPFYRMF